MCAYAEEWLVPSILEKSKYIAQFICVDVVQSKGRETLTQPLAPCPFSEWRGWYFCNLPLPATELHFLIVQVEERRMDRPHLGKPRNVLQGMAGGVGTVRADGHG